MPRTTAFILCVATVLKMSQITTAGIQRGGNAEDPADAGFDRARFGPGQGNQRYNNGQGPQGFGPGHQSQGVGPRESNVEGETQQEAPEEETGGFGQVLAAVVGNLLQNLAANLATANEEGEVSGN